MLYIDMRTFFSGNYMKHVNIHCGQNVEILILNFAVPTVIAKI